MCLSDKHTVLVIDDDVDIREAMLTVLSEEGYTVIGAVNGEHGLEIIRSQCDEICLILVDLLMPRVDGWHVIAEVIQRYSHIPVHAITATHHRLPLGVETTKKPFKLDEMLDLVAAYCNGTRKRTNPQGHSVSLPVSSDS